MDGGNSDVRYSYRTLCRMVPYRGLGAIKIMRLNDLFERLGGNKAAPELADLLMAGPASKRDDTLAAFMVAYEIRKNTEAVEAQTKALNTIAQILKRSM